jgi:hypothetical protein
MIYLKAVLLGHLRNLASWKESEASSSLSDDRIVYLDTQFRVVSDIFPDATVLVDDRTESWRSACVEGLGLDPKYFGTVSPGAPLANLPIGDRSTTGQ